MDVDQHELANRKDLTPSKLLEQWLQDEQFKEYLELNEYNQVYWFNKEKFESMLWYMHIASILRFASNPDLSSVEQIEAILRAEPIFAHLKKAFEVSEFRLDKLQRSS